MAWGKRTKLRMLSVTLFAGILSISCGLDCLFAQEILLETPQRPKVWQTFETMEFEVQWIDASGIVQHANLKEGASVELKLLRGESQAILLLPQGDSAPLKPAGFIYPLDLQASEPFQSWTHRTLAKATYGSGYEAMVALALEDAGYDFWHWPVERLAEASLSKGIDPWALSPEKAASLLIQGSFRLTTFPKPKTPYELPNPGPWWPESPFCQISETTDDKKGLYAKLADGVYRFFSESGTLVVRVESGKVLSQEVVTRSAGVRGFP